MDKIKLTKLVIDKLAMQGHIKNKTSEIISETNNLVYKIDDNFLKIYRNNITTIKDNELLFYNKTKNHKLYKNKICSGTIDLENNSFEYALFSPIYGTTLDNSILEHREYKIVAQSILDYIEDVGKIQCSKFGDINNSFEGNYDNFMSFIYDFVHKTSTELFTNPTTRKYSTLAYNTLLKNSDSLEKIKTSYIIPVDLNMKNFIWTQNKNLIVVDPGALIAGPKEMAYGELMAHTYGTPIFDEFIKLINPENQKLLYTFSILSLSNILSFITKNKICEPSIAKPFGNNYTFFELLDINESKLQEIDYIKSDL